MDRALLPRVRRLSLAHNVPKRRVFALLKDLRQLPGVVGVHYDTDAHDLVVRYDLAVVCRSFLDRWLQERGIPLLETAAARAVAEAVHAAEEVQRRAVLGELADEISCGSPKAYERLAALYDERAEAKAAAVNPPTDDE